MIEDSKSVNITAKNVALFFGILNVSIYLFLIAGFFFSEHLFNRLIDFSESVAIAIYGSFIISLAVGSFFKIAPKQMQVQVGSIYAALFVFNCATLLIFIGFSHIGDGGWLH